MRVGNYTLLDLLGRGGTSEVYAAEDALGEPVAVKVLRPALVLDAATVSAFIEEGVRTRDLAHPSVVRVLDVGSDAATGSCYLVMERIVGESLATRLARQVRLDEPTLRALAAEVADGMQAAHARGIVHRDLKPGNIMLRGSAPRDLAARNVTLRGNAPVIIDFGIAKSLGASSAVVTERRIGTLAYMAPEQLADGLITPAADIWALGVILFEAATGQLPFASFHGGKLPQLVETAPRAATLAPISPAFDDLIARCLERDPGKRPPSMAEIARVLRGDADERITEDVGARVNATAFRAFDHESRGSVVGASGPPSPGRGAAIRTYGVRTRGTSSGGVPEIRTYGVRTVRTLFLRISGKPLLIVGIASMAAIAVIVLATQRGDGGASRRADEAQVAPAIPAAPAIAPTTDAGTATIDPIEGEAVDVGADAVEHEAVESEAKIRNPAEESAQEPARAQTERTRKRTTKRTKVREKGATKEPHATKPREKRTTSQGETLD